MQVNLILDILTLACEYWQGEFQNWRMHDECYQDADDNDSLTEGFMDGDGEMPDRIKEIANAERAAKLAK